MAQYLALAILLAVYLVHLSYVDSEARTCYFGPPPAPDPDNPDPHHWMKQALEQVRKNCPGRRGSTVVKCQPLPAPNNGTVTSCTKDGQSRVTTDHQLVRTKCDVACDGGYTLSGFASRICLENGTWNGTDAKCTVVHVACSPLPVPANGVSRCVRNHRRSKNDLVDSTCNVTCNEGYALNGSASRNCMINGTWNGTEAECTGITCASSDLPAPLNGRKSGCGDQVPYGDICTLSCNAGYKPVSAVQITCGSDDNGNGMWSADIFQCTDIDDCAAQPCVNGGTCRDDVNSFMCDCVAGFTGNDCATNINECDPDPCLNGGTCSDGINTYTCTCAPGYTDINCATAIRCAVNDHLASVYGSTTGCSGDYGESCMLSCDQGFKPTTSMVVTCKSDDNGDGVWSTMCTQITCAIHDLPVSTSDSANCLQQEHAMYGTTFTLACNDNTAYGLISCTSDNGTWSTSNIDGCADEWLVYKHVGLEYRSIIPDDRLAASSRYNSNGERPAKDGRLNNNWHWCAAYSDSNQWIEVDLMTSTVVAGVITQGSSASQSRVTQYQVAYQTTSSPIYVHVLSGTENIKTFSGNLDDAATPVIQFFLEGINATRVKIELLDWYNKEGGRTPCLRFELLGCRLN